MAKIWSVITMLLDLSDGEDMLGYRFPGNPNSITTNPQGGFDKYSRRIYPTAKIWSIITMLLDLSDGEDMVCYHHAIGFIRWR